ncbi:hypothetical protein [Haloferax sp. DFSO60]|uniref:DUF7345 domain-containing protein n=1 Tax=Haloferax sp. DFSO60 TaxID=3388652 RepID=UPI003978FD62
MSSEPAALIANNSSAFIIALEPDGSAQVSLRLVYDLTAEAERTGFERVKANASTFADAYATRLEPLAARASNETGREMSIRSPDAEFKTIHSGTTGVVELSATWTNIATERDGRVVLAEPFNDGFAPERPFVVNAPDGYELVSVAPNPNGETRSTVAWTDGQSLDGFAVEFEATGMANEETTPVTTSSSEMPVGAAPVLALLAVVSVVAVLVRKPE